MIKKIKTTEESVVMSMDGTDKALFPYLNYILQDIWEIGTNPDVIIKLISKHFINCNDLKVLDLGCGKGAVSIKVAKNLGCKCVGIDGLPEFIEYAQKKAIELKVENLCTFETGDMREKVKDLNGYDIIILGSIGPVFGDYFTTLTTLSKYVKKGGIFIIDDCYIENNSDYFNPRVLKLKTILQQIDSAGMQLIDNEVISKDNLKDSDNYIFEKLKKRCFELIEHFPDKKELFLNYIKKQKDENDVLENKVVCTTMIIKRKNRK